MTRFVTSLAIVLLVANSCSAELVIVGYDTTNPNESNNDPAPNLPAAANESSVTPRDLMRGPGLTPNAGATFNSRDWTMAASLNLSSDDFVSWGWSASDTLWDLTTLDIEYDVSPTGPTQLAIALSANGGAFEVFFNDDLVSPGDESKVGISLTQFTVVSTAEFRLFGFGPNFDGRNRGSGGTLDIENIELIPSNNLGIIVSGNAVPEPGAGLVCLLGAVALARRRQRA